MKEYQIEGTARIEKSKKEKGEKEARRKVHEGKRGGK